MTKVETVTASELSEIDDAMFRWWELLLAHAESQDDADCLIADAWAETGRLIGNVQRAEEEIGTDRGTRVVLNVRALSAMVRANEFSSQAHGEAHQGLYEAFERTRIALVHAGRFATLWGGEPKGYYCEEGNPVADPCFVPKTKPRAKSKSKSKGKGKGK